MSWNKTSSQMDTDIEQKSVSKSWSYSLKAVERRQLLFQKITLLLVGLCSLNVWNVLLGLNFTDTKVYAFQLSGLLVSSLYFMFVKVPRGFLPYFLIGLILTCVLFQLSHFLLDDTLFDYACAVIIFFIGLLAGASQISACSIAANLKENLSGYISAGFGISGIFNFLTNLILDQIVSNQTKHLINSQKVLILYIICEIVLAVTVTLCFFVLPLHSKKVDKETGEELIEEPRKSCMPTPTVVKDVIKPVLNEFFVNFVTLNIFPTVGHLLWQKSHKFSNEKATIVLGMYQVFDFISRYLPNMAQGNKYLSFLVFSSNTLMICNVCRLIFVGWFLLNVHQKTGFFANFVQQCVCMALFAITNGWFCTLPYVTFVNEMKIEKTVKNIEMEASLIVTSMFLGLGCGIWSGLIYSLLPV